jgi:hypothetical protein
MQIAAILNNINSHFNIPFFALTPKKTPINGIKNIAIIYIFPDAPNVVPNNIPLNINTKITKVISEKTLYLFNCGHLLQLVVILIHFNPIFM